MSTLSHLEGKHNLFTTMDVINAVWLQMETILSSFSRRALMLIPIAAGMWVMSLYISSRRAFARVRRISIHFEGESSDHVGV
jgi:hypothetical protein